LVCLILGLCAACGRSFPAGRTPTETIRSLEGALRERNYAACYDLLAPEGQAQLDQQLRAAQTVCKSFPQSIRDQLDLDDFCDASPREALQDAADRANDADPALAKQLESFQLAVLKVDEHGDRATVQVAALWKNRRTESYVGLVRHKSRWYLESEAGLNSVPLPKAPTVDCTTFT
jgi:hypothetical protein